VKELHGDPTVGRALLLGLDQRSKIGRSSAQDGAPERLRYETVKVEVSQILKRVSAGAA